MVRVKHVWAIAHWTCDANWDNSNHVPTEIVCNTFAKGEWGKEERKSNPYKKGDDIDIRIRAHDSKFQIFVDQDI
ncbi:hypothetical protein ANCDUO_15076 [Ancylostoma duodenale]|uniref:Galectin n=1 Tax=Ancylostoma duodenale TaxID=51022 RepID=A0A0C2GCL2_9BILA|nr:hypothetical protein ANCDUO_15076 [Ancylostoma duodenale]